MKKKITVLLLALALLLLWAVALWARQEAKSEPLPTTITTAPSSAPTVAPTLPPPTEPDWQLGIVRAGPAEAVYTHFSKGDTLEVIGAFQDYYVVSHAGGDLLIEKRFLRTEGEAPFEIYTGYARSGTSVYGSAFFDGDVIATLGLNQAVTVTEGKGDWLFISWDTEEGYVRAEDILATPVSTNRGNSGAGGNANSSGDSTPIQDGTDVDVGSLATGGVHGGIVLLSDFDGSQTETCPEAGPAVVLADQIPGCLLLLSRGDAVKVIVFDDQQATIWLDADHTAILPRFLLRLNEDQEPTAQTLYSAPDAAVYSDYRLKNPLLTLPVNTPVEVLEILPTCYVVGIDGEISYMSPAELSATPYVTGGGSAGPSGASGSASASDDDGWTPPAM